MPLGGQEGEFEHSLTICLSNTKFNVRSCRSAQNFSEPVVTNVSDALTNISNAVSNQQNLVTLFNALVKKLGVLVKVGGEVAKVFSSVSSFLLHDLSGSFF